MDQVITQVEFFEFWVIQLSSIVSDNVSGKFELTNDYLSDEVLNLLLGNLCQRLNFDLFCKVVDCNNEKLSLSDCLWKKIGDVNPPLHNRLRHGD